MGEVKLTCRIANPSSPDRLEDCEVLADSGATLSLFPKSLLDELGIPPQKEMEFHLADGRIMRRKVGIALVSIDGDAVPARVIFGEPADAPLLGLTVMEQMGLAVDPIARRLVPAKFLLY